MVSRKFEKANKKRELEPGFSDDSEACRISCGAATAMVNQTWVTHSADEPNCNRFRQ
jgi:hypothetical protein